MALYALCYLFLFTTLSKKIVFAVLLQITHCQLAKLSTSSQLLQDKLLLTQVSPNYGLPVTLNVEMYPVIGPDTAN